MTPAGTSIVGFADDVLVVCTADDVRILELGLMKVCDERSAGWR